MSRKDTTIMPYDTAATTQPDQADAKSSSEAEETSPQPNPEPVHEETGGTPDQEKENAEPDQMNMNPEPEFEKIKPTVDLKKLFTFNEGYRNPPKGYWFPKGISGNPNGRPPGSKNKPKKLTAAGLLSVFEKDVKSMDGRTMSTATAMLEKLAELALSGNIAAIKLSLATLGDLNAADAKQQEAEYNFAAAWKDHWDHPFQRFTPERDLAVPHPDHIILDPRNKRVYFTGPRNEEEMRAYLAGKDFREEDTEAEDKEEEVLERTFRKSELDRRSKL